MFMIGILAAMVSGVCLVESFENFDIGVIFAFIGCLAAAIFFLKESGYGTRKNTRVKPH